MQETVLRANTILAAANLLLILALCWANRKEIREKIPDKKKLLPLIAILALGLALRVYISPHEPQSFTDEWVFKKGAETIPSGIYATCEYGRQAECKAYGLPLTGPEPGYPIFIAIANALLGAGKQAGYIFSLLFSTLTIGLVYASYRLVFKEEKGALLAALIFAMLPMSITYSTTAAKDSAAIFFFMASAVTMMIADNREKMLYLSAALLGFTLNTATGYLILVPVLAVLNRNKIGKLIGPVLLVLALSGFIIGEKAFGMKEGAGDAPAMIDMSGIAEKTIRQLENWTMAGLHSQLLFLLAGYFIIAGRKTREYLALLLWLAIPIAFFAIHAMNLECDMNRHMLYAYPAFALMAANGLSRIRGLKAGSALLLILIASMALYLPEGGKNNACWDVHQKEAAFLKDAGEKIGGNCTIITTQTALVETEADKSILEIGFALERREIADAAVEKCALLFESSDCADKAGTRDKWVQACKEIKNRYGAAAFLEGEIRAGEQVKMYLLGEGKIEGYAVNIAGLLEGEERRFEVLTADANGTNGARLENGTLRIREELMLPACGKIGLIIAREKNVLRIEFEPDKGCDNKCYTLEGNETGCHAPVDLEIGGIGEEIQEIRIYEQGKLLEKIKR